MHSQNKIKFRSNKKPVVNPGHYIELFCALKNGIIVNGQWWPPDDIITKFDDDTGDCLIKYWNSSVKLSDCHKTWEVSKA